MNLITTNEIRVDYHCERYLGRLLINEVLYEMAMDLCAEAIVPVKSYDKFSVGKNKWGKGNDAIPDHVWSRSIHNNLASTGPCLSVQCIRNGLWQWGMPFGYDVMLKVLWDAIRYDTDYGYFPFRDYEKVAIIFDDRELTAEQTAEAELILDWFGRKAPNVTFIKKIKPPTPNRDVADEIVDLLKKRGVTVSSLEYVFDRVRRQANRSPINPVH